MVKLIAENGEGYYEAPYTPAEEMAFYKRIENGPVTVVKRAPGLHQRAQPPAPAKKPRS